jgi:hypothetical protein
MMDPCQVRAEMHRRCVYVASQPGVGTGLGTWYAVCNQPATAQTCTTDGWALLLITCKGGDTSSYSGGGGEGAGMTQLT